MSFCSNVKAELCRVPMNKHCCAVAEDPCLKDVGILASLDPVAVDRACLDLIYHGKDPGRAHFLERVESRNGAHTLDAAREIGLGETEYELILVK